MIHNNPIRGRINAWILTILDRYMHWKYGAVKQALFEGAPEELVELGSGTGANLRYIAAGKKLIAVEPNIHMHPTLIKKAAKRKVRLDLRGLSGEQLDLPTDSVDFVFCTLVLCTVDNPKQVISEVRRVLKPGGRFVCIEHVKAPQSSMVRKVQSVIRKPWKWFFEGCDVCRDTGLLLETSGFSAVQINLFTMPTVLVPIRTQVIVTCTN